MEYSFKKVFVAACLGMVSFGAVVITLGSLLPELIDKFSLDKVQAGFLSSLLPAGILAGSLLFGPLADRYGYKGLMIGSALFETAGILLLGNVPLLVLVQAGVFLFGFGGGVVNGAANSLVADISVENKGANLSMLGVFYGIGALSMPFIMGLLTGIFPFSVILTGMGVFMMLIGTYYTLTKFPQPKQAQGFPISESGKLLGNLALLFAGTAMAFGSSIEGTMNNWLTTFFRENELGTASEGLYFLTVMVLSLSVMRLFLGFILKKFNAFKVMIFFALFLLVGFVLLYTGSRNAVFAGVICIGVGTAGNFPIMLGFIAELFPRLSGTAFGVMFSMALAGNTFAQIGMGSMAENWSINTLPLFGGVLSVSMILFMLFFRAKADKTIFAG